ncbi:MAG: uroporphyrinogen decarboxylase family protein [Verrucomicrobiota bacterium]|nr:uroporphyrinogen decarboxylase family protein [Verrucomicrobiota bacterium]
MNSRERVQAVIRHQKPDRTPLYGWVSANMGEPITKAFGSVEAFEDHYEFDLAHVFGGPYCHFLGDEFWKRMKAGETIEPPDVADLPLCDPNATEAYEGLKKLVAHHKARDRFIYVQTPGLFEHYNSTFGIENHLAYLLLFPDELRVIYQKQVEWTKQFANNCIDLGVDMIHISDDWGGQQNTLFSPAIWYDLIHPNIKQISAAVKARGAFLSLHSDGCIQPLVDGILDLGFDVVHPWQESAGMSMQWFHDNLRKRLTVMGGLDVQTTIGFGKHEVLRSEIERVLRLFNDGGLLYCTTHFVQDHCTIEELVLAYDLANRLRREN